jgi:hypothetical protein
VLNVADLDESKGITTHQLNHAVHEEEEEEMGRTRTRLEQKVVREGYVESGGTVRQLRAVRRSNDSTGQRGDGATG